MSIEDPVILFTIPLPILLKSVVLVEDDEPFVDAVADVEVVVVIDGVVWVVELETLETIEKLLRMIS